MKRNPHPARISRIVTLGISTTAFVSIVTSFTWNTHQADLAANVTDANAVPVETIASAISTTTTAPVATNPATPAATIAPSAPAKSQSTPVSTESKKAAAPATTQTVAPATPVVPATPTTPEVAPAVPAPTVVYTCMSPGGKTETPTSTGKCKNAKYGYVLTQI